MTGVNRHYVAEAKKLKTEDPDEFERLKEGSVTLPQARKKRRLKLQSGVRPVRRFPDPIFFRAGFMSGMIVEFLCRPASLLLGKGWKTPALCPPYSGIHHEKADSNRFAPIAVLVRQAFEGKAA